MLETSLVFPHAVVETHRALSAPPVSPACRRRLRCCSARVTLKDYDLSSLRYLTQAGGAMSLATTQRLRAALPHARLFVMYGQTEATARLTYLPPADLDRKLGSVGVAVPGCRPPSALAKTASAAAASQPAKVWARGPNVMLGYWNNPAATAACCATAGCNTGDIGHLDADGFLFLAGRRSDMIKTGAHRVHPQDVEEVIAELAEVAEVAVVGVDDEMLGQAIKAFVVAANGRRVSTRCTSRRIAAQRLATYKIPKHVDFVGSLPKTASGKMRRA